MKLARIVLALAALGIMAGLAYVAQGTDTAGGKMIAAAQALLDALSAEQKARATFAFDSPERTNWHFIPLQDKMRKATRKGLPLEDMTPPQKKAALALVAAGTSATGFVQATTIMELEAILREQEKKGTTVRNPEWYFFTLFGTPARKGQWGWRVEGHHLSLNFTVVDGQVASATPAMFGANPAQVLDGPKKGLRILAASEDYARELFEALDGEQKKVALQPKPFPEIEQAKAKPNVGEPRGLPAAQMSQAQKAMLTKLLHAYTDRLPADVAAREWQHVRAAGLDQIHFAFTGDPARGRPHTYRVQGPSFVIEFLNEQKDALGTPANHIHSAWRRLAGDFGLYATAP